MSILSPRSRSPLVTFALVTVSVVVAIASNFGANARVVLPLLIAEPGSAPFAEIASGEVWRLVTPIFVHLSFVHVLFNMLWTWDLGRAVEQIRGPRFMAAFVALSGIASNIAQYGITGSPLFGGMSGVVYALLGYVWMQGRFNPTFGIALHRSTVIMMLAWFVVCWTGLLGPIANWAHTAGLAIGVAWGYRGGRRA